MYFHLIGIKENNGENFELELLIQGGDENFVRKFFANWGVVIVSIVEFKDDPKTFGNIRILVNFENQEIEILTSGEDLSDSAYFFISLGLGLHFINYVNNPISEGEMKETINNCITKIQEEVEQIKREKEEKEISEKKKYEESAIDDALKIINIEIDRIDQIIKAGNGILSGTDVKKLEDLGNEMKKVRLGTNFNKMTSLILDAHELVRKTENDILSEKNSKEFLIDKNSITTNVDFIYEISNFNRISEKAVVQPNGLTTSESIRNIFGVKSVFLDMLVKDFAYTCKSSSISEIFEITMSYVEYIVLIIILIVSFLWLMSPLFGIDKFSLYLLPALGWLSVLLYIFNNLKLKGLISKIVGFIVIACVYRYGLTLLKGTFAL